MSERQTPEVGASFAERRAVYTGNLALSEQVLEQNPNSFSAQVRRDADEFKIARIEERAAEAAEFDQAQSRSIEIKQPVDLGQPVVVRHA